jgi:hypothetical protein
VKWTSTAEAITLGRDNLIATVDDDAFGVMIAATNKHC